MALTEFDRHDHPEMDQLRAQVGCSLCGRAVQSDQEDRALAMKEMAGWSQKHATTHPQEEHDRAHREFEEGRTWRHPG